MPNSTTETYFCDFMESEETAEELGHKDLHNDHVSWDEGSAEDWRCDFFHSVKGYEETDIYRKAGTLEQLNNVSSKSDINKAGLGWCDTVNNIDQDRCTDLCTDGPTDGLHPNEIYKQDDDGDTMLHVAIISLDTSLALRYIAAATSPDMLSIRNRLQQTPLHLAVLTNQERVVRCLLAAGADVTARDRNGNTPLLVSCKTNNIEIVRALLESVPYNETTDLGYRPLYQGSLQDLEVKNYDGLTALHIAASNSVCPVLELLVGKGADVNAIDGKSGRTVLHRACLTGDVELAKYLTRLNNCDINAKTFDDYTPFDLARVRGHDEIQILLAKVGAGTEMVHFDA